MPREYAKTMDVGLMPANGSGQRLECQCRVRLQPAAKGTTKGCIDGERVNAQGVREWGLLGGMSVLQGKTMDVGSMPADGSGKRLEF